MLRKLIQDNPILVGIPIVAAVAIVMFTLILTMSAAINSADAADAPSSESESPAQVTVEDFELLGCAEHICVYLVDVPYGDDCVLAIETFIMDQSVFELECPGS